MLRIALSFALALSLGGLACGVALTRFVPLPVPSAASSDAAGSDDAPQLEPAGPMKHLPDWVQTRQVANLWSSPDKDAASFTSLPVWTFLKVSGAQGARLLVQYAGDDQSRQPGPGWVDLDDVQPSDSGEGWLRNHRATQLFAAATGSSPSTDVPQWSWMVSLGETVAGRIHVHIYSPNLHSLAADGWIPASDVGPSGPPQQSVYTASTHPTTTDAMSHDAFIASIAAAAASTSGSTHVAIPVSVTIAQAILESNWGQSALSREANNFFGVKATGGIGNDGAVWMPTLEYTNGGSYTVVAPFRAYKSLADSVLDHSAMFRRSSTYRDALQATGSPDEFARRIARDGYATDPQYADKLIALMQHYNLYQYDGQPATPGSSTAAA